MSRCGLRHRCGLTLIEILVATSLAIFLIATATAGFLQVRALTRRVDAQLQLHNEARLIFERLQADLSTLMQGSAVFAAGQPDRVEWIFLRGKLDNVDFTLGSDFGANLKSRTDQVWSRVAWDVAKRRLTVATSSPERSFTINTMWGSLGSWQFSNKTFYQLPKPQRAMATAPASAGATLSAAQSTLNKNNYGTGSYGDMGDYDDLLQNALPISSWCTGFSLQFILQDGTQTAVISDSSGGYYAGDGQYVDGRGGSQLERRPRLVRTWIQLTEPMTGVVSEFSFSFLLPALSPQ